MKFLRSVTVLIITVVFLAAFAIGIGVIFSVKNVNVTLLSYEYAENSEEAKQEISSIKEGVLSVCRGNVISFVKEDEIVESIDEKYFVESVEKIYPCTINITVKQRNEVYVISKGDEFAVYDADGNYLKDAETNQNSLDGAPNVFITGAKSQEEIKTAAGLGSKFKARFGSVRSIVDTINIQSAETTFAKDKLIFILRCGIKIEIQDYNDAAVEKIDEAYREFDKLTGEQKLKGTIYCLRDKDGNITRTYNANA